MKSARGMSLVDVVVGSFLVLVIFIGLFALMRAALATASAAKAKAGAVAVLTSNMEHVRGLSYEDIGTVNGIPPGILSETATTTNAGFTYSVRTFVQYIDDAADGTGDDDENGIITDHKRVKLEVVYAVSGKERSLPLVFTVAPNGVESSQGGGLIRIEVVDASGAGVPGAEVVVENTELSPHVSVTTFTNTDGIVLLSGAATSSAYEITVTKDGYGDAMTYDRNAENANPTPGHLTVAEAETTTGTFVIDALASLTVRTFSASEEGMVSLPNVSYTLTGTKTIGSTALGAPLLKTEISDTTGASGTRTDSFEFDVYTLAVSGYDVIDACEMPPFSLSPGSSVDAALTLGPSTARSLLVGVRNHAGAIVSNTSVTVSRSGYAETKTSSTCGSAYFGNLPAGEYTVTIAKEGYETVEYENVSVSNQTFYVALFE